MRFYRVYLWGLAVLTLIVSSASQATTPLRDSIEYDGRVAVVWTEIHPWLELPENDKLIEMQRQERCTAIGGPRGNWRLENGRLWLTGLFRCAGPVPLDVIYEGRGEPIFADWISGRLLTNRGKILCRRPFDVLTESTLALDVVKGIVVGVTDISNAKNPEVPTTEDLRKIYASAGTPFNDKDLEQIVDAGEWHCLSSVEQKALRGEARAE